MAKILTLAQAVEDVVRDGDVTASSDIAGPSSSQLGSAE